MAERRRRVDEAVAYFQPKVRALWEWIRRINRELADNPVLRNMAPNRQVAWLRRLHPDIREGPFGPDSEDFTFVFEHATWMLEVRLMAFGDNIDIIDVFFEDLDRGCFIVLFAAVSKKFTVDQVDLPDGHGGFVHMQRPVNDIRESTLSEHRDYRVRMTWDILSRLFDVNF